MARPGSFAPGVGAPPCAPRTRRRDPASQRAPAAAASRSTGVTSATPPARGVRGGRRQPGRGGGSRAGGRGPRAAASPRPRGSAPRPRLLGVPPRARPRAGAGQGRRRGQLNPVGAGRAGRAGNLAPSCGRCAPGPELCTERKAPRPLQERLGGRPGGPLSSSHARIAVLRPAGAAPLVRLLLFLEP